MKTHKILLIFFLGFYTFYDCMCDDSKQNVQDKHNKHKSRNKEQRMGRNKKLCAKKLG